jgi:hypothetical protein
LQFLVQSPWSADPPELDPILQSNSLPTTHILATNSRYIASARTQRKTAWIVDETCLPLDCLAIDVLLLRARVLRPCVYRPIA